ncbi:HofP DNA utilization family protein [Yokenella regensburgei]|jgi:pilus assembly protein HofP|uniref:HofP DNA utilization family protein n=1 Tax=Yokenella regensburgei TaxID=158877 RepID=UPI001432C37B|nr:HofP DNA utilization family protein [Yokenella regensburgei]QIU90774.1 DUF2531 family protein [Yokenella regensburgei]
MTPANRLLMVLLLPALLGMRDPFMPPEDKCQSDQLTQWRYQGFVTNKQRALALLRDGDNKWHRVAVDDLLAPGWRVLRFDAGELEVKTGPGCEPERWAWNRKKENNNEMDNAAAGSHDVPGAGRTKGDAGGG